jgi:hypothetical protein
LLPADMNDQHQAADEAQCGHYSVRGQDKMANVDKTGKHVVILDGRERESGAGELSAVRYELSAKAVRQFPAASRQLNQSR